MNCAADQSLTRLADTIRVMRSRGDYRRDSAEWLIEQGRKLRAITKESVARSADVHRHASDTVEQARATLERMKWIVNRAIARRRT